MVEEIGICHQDLHWLLEGRRGDLRGFLMNALESSHQQVQKELMRREGMDGVFSSTHVLFEAVV